MAAQVVQLGSRVRVRYEPSVHGIVIRFMRSAGIDWASVLIPNLKVGYMGRTENHPVDYLDVVEEDPNGWIDPDWRIVR
jgi:hypothetical protein